MVDRNERRLGLWLAIAVLVVGIVGWLWLRTTDESSDPERSGSVAGEASQRRMLVGSEKQSDSELSRRAALLQAQKAVVFGRVHEPDGQAVVGATVCASLRSRVLVLKPLNSLRCVTSEADGHYRIEGLLPVDTTVSASAPQHIPNHFRRPERGPNDEILHLMPGGEYGEIDVELRTGGVKIEGVVMDISGGEIEGAQVASNDAYTRSDADGGFTLWVEPGEASVSARAQGYAKHQSQGIAPGHEFELVLTPESVLVGKVVAAETGAPLADVDVFAVDWGRRWGGSGPDAVSRGDGSFRIDGLEPGPYKPIAFNERTYGTAETTVHLGLGQTSDEVVIKVHPAFSVQGTIMTGDEKTCPSGRVVLRDPANKRNVASQVERDGDVRVHGVLPGTYDVDVRCEGFVSREHYDAIEVSEPVLGKVWEVEPGLAIRGIVVDASGEPVGGTNVVANQVLKEGAPRAKRSFSWGQETREDGRFELEGLRPGGYEIKLIGFNRPSPAEPVKLELDGEDVNDLRIELKGEGVVRGRVMDARGEPVANVTIDLDAVERGGWTGSQSTRSADDGTFSLEHVEAGSYRVLAKQGWRATLRAPGTSDDDVQGVAVEVAVDEVTEVELKVEARGASIRGTVVDADGGPIADAFLSATRESDSATKVAGSSMRASRWGSWWKKPVLTDADGSFELVDLSEGVYTVRAYRKGGGEGFSDGIETGSSCTVAIRSTGTLMGRVTLAGGPAPEEFAVTLRDRKAGVRRNETFFRTGGVFRFEELPGGNYELSAAAGKGSARGQATLGEGEDKSGVELDMQASVKVRGKLVDEDSGEPVVGLRVSIRPLGGGMRGGGTTAARKEVSDAQGVFEIDNAPSGKVSVSVQPENFLGSTDYGYSSIPREIPSSDSVHELGPIQLIKKRLDEDEAGGDAGYRLRERKPDEDWNSRELKVAFVRPGSPAATAGMQVGDVLVKVDGKDVTGDNVYRYYSLVNAPVGTTLTIEVKSGASYKLVLEKQR